MSFKIKYNKFNIMSGVSCFFLSSGFKHFDLRDFSKSLSKDGSSVDGSRSLLKVTDHSKKFFFWFITCTFYRPSLRLFRFTIDQFVPFCIFHEKRDKLINFKSN